MSPGNVCTVHPLVRTSALTFNIYLLYGTETLAKWQCDIVFAILKISMGRPCLRVFWIGLQHRRFEATLDSMSYFVAAYLNNRKYKSNIFASSSFNLFLAHSDQGRLSMLFPNNLRPGRLQSHYLSNEDKRARFVCRQLNDPCWSFYHRVWASRDRKYLLE